jgi:membrane dipeptidase
MNRRRLLASAAAVATAAALAPWPARAQARPLRFADMHTHIGVFRSTGSIRETMIRNGMLVLARKVVADQPVIGSLPGRGLQTMRAATPGELAQYFDARIGRLRAQHREERLAEIVSAEALDRAVGSGEPAVALAAEGGDFLEGDLKRLESARAIGLVHLQLVHYRVSEVGDISTERPVHNGLTSFGKDVVAACNRLRILVDIAHGTSAVIEQTLDLAAKPIIYSHGHVTSGEPHWSQNPIRARAIHKPLAVKIAKKGGVIGIWPLGSMYRSLDAYADALLDAAEALGPAHVGVGSDMSGLPTTVIPDYEAYPALVEILAKRRVKAEDIENLLGRNYLRVLRQSLAT